MGQGLVGLIKGAGIDDLLWMEYVLLSRYYLNLFDMECHVTQCNSLNHVDTFDFAVKHSGAGFEIKSLGTRPVSNVSQINHQSDNRHCQKTKKTCR